MQARNQGEQVGFPLGECVRQFKKHWPVLESSSPPLVSQAGYGPAHMPQQRNIGRKSIQSLRTQTCKRLENHSAIRSVFFPTPNASNWLCLCFFDQQSLVKVARFFLLMWHRFQTEGRKYRWWCHLAQRTAVPDLNFRNSVCATVKSVPTLQDVEQLLWGNTSHKTVSAAFGVVWAGSLPVDAQQSTNINIIYKSEREQSLLYLTINFTL